MPPGGMMPGMMGCPRSLVAEPRGQRGDHVARKTFGDTDGHTAQYPNEKCAAQSFHHTRGNHFDRASRRDGLRIHARFAFGFARKQSKQSHRPPTICASKPRAITIFKSVSTTKQAQLGSAIGGVRPSPVAGTLAYPMVSLKLWPALKSDIAAAGDVRTPGRVFSLSSNEVGGEGWGEEE